LGRKETHWYITQQQTKFFFFCFLLFFFLNLFIYVFMYLFIYIHLCHVHYFVLPNLCTQVKANASGKYAGGGSSDGEDITQNTSRNGRQRNFM
jgi:hypothetical protein